MELTDQFVRALARAGYDPGQPLGIAFSGGLDSTALLLLAGEVLPKSDLIALHIDHDVRPNSRRDADHCRRVAGRLGVRFAAETLQSDRVQRLTRARGLEGALRELRYKELAEMCRAHHVEWLAVAHNADDALESHLLALIRGAGLTGLGGPHDSLELGEVHLVRPLLEVSRHVLEAYVGSRPEPVAWVEDETNLDVRFARNRLRHEVIPILVDLAGSPAPLLRAVSTLREDREALSKLLDDQLGAAGIDPRAPTLDLSDKPGLGERVLTEAIRRYVALHGSGRPPTRHHVSRLMAAIAEPGRSRIIDMPQLRVRVEGGRVSVDRSRPEPSTTLALRLGETVTSPSMGLSLAASVEQASGPIENPDDPNRVEFDLETLGPHAANELILRAARPGDRFRPFGLGGSVRLLRWLAGAGIPRSARTFVPVVEYCGSIIWVVSRRRSDLAPITSETRRKLVLIATNE